MAAEDEGAPAPPGGNDVRDDDRRPWGRFYALVLAWLAVIIVLLLLLTWAYR
jgi:hypothetical protein